MQKNMSKSRLAEKQFQILILLKRAFFLYKGVLDWRTLNFSEYNSNYLDSALSIQQLGIIYIITCGMDPITKINCNNSPAFIHVLNWKLFPFQLMMKALELCLKTYGKSHRLYVDLLECLSFLYEEDCQFEKSYDYLIRSKEKSVEVSFYCFSETTVFLHFYFLVYIL